MARGGPHKAWCKEQKMANPQREEKMANPRLEAYLSAVDGALDQAKKTYQALSLRNDTDRTLSEAPPLADEVKRRYLPVVEFLSDLQNNPMLVQWRTVRVFLGIVCLCVSAGLFVLFASSGNLLLVFMATTAALFLYTTIIHLQILRAFSTLEFLQRHGYLHVRSYKTEQVEEALDLRSISKVTVLEHGQVVLQMTDGSIQTLSKPENELFGLLSSLMQRLSNTPFEEQPYADRLAHARGVKELLNKLSKYSKPPAVRPSHPPNSISE